MSSREEIVLECDRCGTQRAEDHVETIEVGALEGEACQTCKKEILSDALEMFLDAARPTNAVRPTMTMRRGNKKDSVVKLANSAQGMDLLRWPDTPWRVTAHALLRMGERHVLMEDVLALLKDPPVRRPSERGIKDTEIWEDHYTKVVVNPSQKAILTVAKNSFDDIE